MKRQWTETVGRARFGVFAVLCALLTFAWTALAADIVIPKLTGRVVDQAGILSSADETKLARKSEALERKTSIQLVVVTLRSLQGRSIEEMGLALGRGWGIGQRGQNTGVLLIVAPNDREVRIEVGYGLEGTLTDTTAGVIIRNIILPRFKAGNMAGGISDGADAIVSVLTGSGEEFKLSNSEVAKNVLDEWLPFVIVGLFFLLVIFANIRDRTRHRRSRYFRNRRGGWVLYDDDHWSGGSSFGGGGGGGFSGGGGSFGGGGASGRW